MAVFIARNCGQIGLTSRRKAEGLTAHCVETLLRTFFNAPLTIAMLL
jgi:hypothetical protein